MERVMTWLGENWWWLLMLAAALAKVLNKATAHWSDREGVVRWLLFVLDVLDVVKATPPPGGKKGVRSGQIGSTGMDCLWGIIAASMIAAGLVLWSGCQTTFPAAMAKSHESLKVMSRAVEPALERSCLLRAEACKAGGIATAEACTPLLECREWKAHYVAGLQLTHQGLATCNRVWDNLVRAGVLP